MAEPFHRDSLDDIAAYYRANREDTRAELQQLEFAVTRALLARYLVEPQRVLELGAGAGQYTRELAQHGHHITAVELVSELTEINRARLHASGVAANVELITTDARIFREQVQQRFDAVLVMGPLYHLISAEERIALMEDVKAALTLRGLVITTHLTRVGLIAYMLQRFPTWALDTPGQVEEILRQGFVSEHPRNGAFRGYWTSLDELHSLHQKVGLEVLHVHSQDPCIGSADEIFNRLPGDFQERWVQVLTRMSEDPMALGSGRSVLCVARNRSG